MDDNKELVLDTEKVETTTEEIEGGESVTEEPVIEQPTIKTYSDKEVDDIVQRRLQRQERQLKKEYKNKYGELEEILKAGLNVETVEQATEQMKNFYKDKGIEVPKATAYDDYDLDILAEVEAKSMIDDYSFDELKQEVDRLASKGLDGMDAREKKVFQKLAEYRQDKETRMELESIGVDESVFTSKEYIDFTSKLNPNMSEKDKYEMYSKYRPMPEVEPIGSMKGNNTQETGVKEYYTYEEASQFTMDDLRKTPGLQEAIEKSMQKWN